MTMLMYSPWNKKIVVSCVGALVGGGAKASSIGDIVSKNKTSTTTFRAISSSSSLSSFFFSSSSSSSAWPPAALQQTPRTKQPRGQLLPKKQRLLLQSFPQNTYHAFSSTSSSFRSAPSTTTTTNTTTTTTTTTTVSSNRIRTARTLPKKTTTTTTTTTPVVVTVCVALSGGVDSSVVAALLQESIKKTRDRQDNGISSSSWSSSSSTTSQGYQYQLQAIHMSNWNARDDDDDNDDANDNNQSANGKRTALSCTAEGGWNDASRVARHLKIPLTRRNYESDYWLSVFEPYLEELMPTMHNNKNPKLKQQQQQQQQQAFRMGNPDIDCNVYIKFGVLRDDCLQRYGPESLLATGHYARLWHRQRRNGEQHNDDKHTYWRHHGLIVDNVDYVELQQEVEESLQDNVEHHWLWTWGNNSSTSVEDSSPLLLAAMDRSKDQSYFLSGCYTHQFRNVIFPLGSCFKKSSSDEIVTSSSSRTTVRQLAREMGLPTAEKKESMGICFVGKRANGFNTFVQGYLPESALSRRVDFIDIDTRVIVATSSSSSSSTNVESKGCDKNDKRHVRPAVQQFYNPGQGAKISGSPTRYFVVRQEVQRSGNDNNNNNNTVVWVCAGTHHPALYADSLTINKMHWMTGEIPSPLRNAVHSTNRNSSMTMMRVQCRIRHLQPLVDCTIVMSNNNNNSSSSSIEVFFDKPLRGISPGQRAVFYAGRNGLICLGGGVIAASGPSYLELGKALPALHELHPSGANDLSVGANALTSGSS
jgi:tRNA-5-taurinomethyluridine 2-sulfurtransferase